MSMNYQSMHSMVWTSANTFPLYPYPTVSKENSMKFNTNYFNNSTSSDEEYDYSEEEEDMLVDLSSGSLEPVPLQGWNLVTEITQKMKNL